MTNLGTDYRQMARDHLARAEELLLSADENAARYACLEIRLAIEAASYSTVWAYRRELSKSSMAHWQPKRVLEELAQIDPFGKGGAHLQIKNERTGGSLSFNEHRFSARWAGQAHNALGSALHVPTVAQVQSSAAASPKELHARCEKYLGELHKALDSKAWNLVFAEAWNVACDCGFGMKRRVDAIEVGGEPFVCSECGRIYDVIAKTDETIRLEPRSVTWHCNHCGTGNRFPEIDVAENYRAKCRACGEEARVRREWCVFQKPETEALEPVGTETDA